MKKPIHIVIADDHQLMLEGLATLVDSIDSFALAGKVNSGKALLEWLQRAPVLPDICVVDIEMPGIDGVETVKAIRQNFPSLKVMVLTMHNESHFVSRMISAGANGYVLKNVDRLVFIRSIERILDGEDFVLEAALPSRDVSDGESLTHREKQILKLIVQGKTNKEIAEELFISDRTADTHRTNIKRKLRLSSLAQLIQYAKVNNMAS
jgi:two-component system, NarL family, nitrate/nitrite response regulator NarL